MLYCPPGGGGRDDVDFAKPVGVPKTTKRTGSASGTLSRRGSSASKASAAGKIMIEIFTTCLQLSRFSNVGKIRFSNMNSFLFPPFSMVLSQHIIFLKTHFLLYTFDLFPTIFEYSICVFDTWLVDFVVPC